MKRPPVFVTKGGGIFTFLQIVRYSPHHWFWFISFQFLECKIRSKQLT